MREKVLHRIVLTITLMLCLPCRSLATDHGLSVRPRKLDTPSNQTIARTRFTNQAPEFDIHFEAKPQWGVMTDLDCYRVVTAWLVEQAREDFTGVVTPSSYTLLSRLRIGIQGAGPQSRIERRFLIWALYGSLLTRAANNEWTMGNWYVYWREELKGVLWFVPTGMVPPTANDAISNGTSSTLQTTRVGQPEPNLYAVEYALAWGPHHLSHEDLYCPIAVMLARAAEHNAWDRFVGLETLPWGQSVELTVDGTQRQVEPFPKWGFIIGALAHVVEISFLERRRSDVLVVIEFIRPHSRIMVAELEINVVAGGRGRNKFGVGHKDAGVKTS